MQKIIISRVDSLGDVVLTLPMAGVLKQLDPENQIIFLGSRYTRPLVETSAHIDSFLDWTALRCLSFSEAVKKLKALQADMIIHVFPHKQIARLAAKAAIPERVGTSRRTYHWLYCNRKVSVPRRNSDLHESQLNLKLLAPLGVKKVYPPSEIPQYYSLENFVELSDSIKNLLSRNRINLILHPRTKGSAREWGIENFSNLVDILPADTFKVFVTGTDADGQALKEFLLKYRERIIDLTGKLSLGELISFIHAADGIVAASTGPLHIAAAVNRYALGLYAPMRPIHAGRWAPIGVNADYLMIDKDCSDCRKSLECACIKSIKPEDVLRRLKDAMIKFSTG